VQAVFYERSVKDDDDDDDNDDDDDDDDKPCWFTRSDVQTTVNYTCTV